MPVKGRSWGFNVSEGELEPPCPLRALAPQASASANSATRNRDAWGTHRLSYLSKPNVPRRVPRLAACIHPSTECCLCGGGLCLDSDVPEERLHADPEVLVVAVDGGPDLGLAAHAGAADPGQ